MKTREEYVMSNSAKPRLAIAATLLLPKPAVLPGILGLLHNAGPSTQVVCRVEQGQRCCHHVHSNQTRMYPASRWFNDARAFVHGFAAVEFRREWHFINLRGKPVNQWRFILVSDVNEEGIASVWHKRFPPDIITSLFVVSEGRFLDPELNAFMKKK